jgi:hypothetical protein
MRIPQSFADEVTADVSRFIGKPEVADQLNEAGNNISYVRHQVTTDCFLVAATTISPDSECTSITLEMANTHQVQYLTTVSLPIDVEQLSAKLPSIVFALLTKRLIATMEAYLAAKDRYEVAKKQLAIFLP